MSAHTKKPLINAHSQSGTLYVTLRHTTYAIPKKIANRYVIDEEVAKKVKKTSAIQMAFAELNNKYTKAGALLKGLRLREGLSQVDFAKKINVTQANLSSMENGKRPIGRVIAKRIAKVFGVNYRYFLE